MPILKAGWVAGKVPAVLRVIDRTIAVIRRLAEDPERLRHRAVPITDPEYAELSRFFADPPDTHGVRSIIDVDVQRVSDSCGYAVPLMDYQGDRDLLIRWNERRSEADFAEYRRVKNGFSIDGQPIFAEP